MHLPKFKSFPYHVIGIILFFLTHGYSEYIGLIPFIDLLILFLWLLLVTGLIFLLFRWRLKSVTESGLLTTLILGFYLFFGTVSDTFKGIPFLSPLAHYRYLLGGFILFTIFLYFYFRRSTAKFQKITLYLNTVFAIFIVYDLFFIVWNIGTQNKKASGSASAFINNYAGHFEKRPDIYFIMMDEYSGSRALNTYWKYNNSSFENSLKDQGFFVARCPVSDYSRTVYSLASILSMDYLKSLRQDKETAVDDAAANKVISNNNVMMFLKSKGYNLYNYSIFDIGGQPSQFNTGLFSFKLKLITSKTLLGRMEKDLIWISLLVGGKVNGVAQKIVDDSKAANENLITLTKAAADNKSPDPKFVYTHLLMPHEPFSYDSSGKEVFINSFREGISPDTLKQAYLQYLIYTNKVVTRLTSYILEKTNRQAAIILMSDHGFRALVENGKLVYSNNNFNAMYIPGQNYKYNYDSIGNVNAFRVLFNTLFEMKLPLLPDSRLR